MFLKPGFPRTLPMSMLWTLALISCGTKVSTGRNADRKQSSQVAPSTKEEKTTDTTRDTVISRSSEDSCFGSSQASEIKQLELFCDNVPDEERAHFAKIIDLICIKKELSNLLLPECGWAGNNGDPRSFLKIHEHTDLEERTDLFYYLGAYSLTVDNTSTSFKDLLFYAHADPQGFSEKYTFPENTVVRPVEPGITQNGHLEELEYELEIKGSVNPTRFKALMRGMTVEDDLEIVFDRTTAVREGIKMRRGIDLSFKVNDEVTKIVVFEEREVPDRRLHPIALKISEGHDLNKMKLFYENAQIQ